MAIFLLMTFLPSLLPVNLMYASNNGPNAPEAGGFEPVDATDMVNLVTGDMSYVLPLLNVPSPEGGYPLALSYHAGIAMDQEASWVGLGWNLNPGSLNRSVNGFPDDWGKTNVSEFFRDAGWTEDVYEFSAGATIDGVTVGLGASWGSNRAFGGEVTFGIGGVYRATMGTNGGSFSAVGPGGVGLSYGFQGNAISLGLNTPIGDSSTSLGFGISYNPNGSNFSLNVGAKSGIVSSSTGISFSSNGTSVSGSTSLLGINSSFASGSIGMGDYFIKTKTKGIDIDLGLFWFKSTKTEIEYSLFKKNNLTVSGTLYPYHSKLVESNLVDEGHFMDVKETFGYNLFEFENVSSYIEGSRIELPNYDGYSLNAQGLSGNIKPAYFYELTLYSRGDKPDDTSTKWKEYLSNPVNSNDFTYDNNNKTYFYLDNATNSFLRVDRTKLNKPSNVTSMSESAALSFYTNNTNNYSSVTTPEGDAIKAGNRMREGNYIETFTNDDIRSGMTGGFFLDAKGLSRSDVKTFDAEGIGAFKVTALDGKVYHYSLPVYNFEEYTKNYAEEADEDQNFLETFRVKPYATHWLLTAITGPDYIKNSTSRDYPDEGDFGYWVRFDYGKWSDGFGWRTPKNGSKKYYRGLDKVNHVYSWGRKQIYYLDAIKTRTHTALFVKGLREDNKSTQLSYYNTLYTTGSFNYGTNPKIFSDENQFRLFGRPGDTFYDQNGTAVVLPSQNGSGTQIEEWVGRKNVAKYVDVPVSSSLKLEKIVLLKNENASYSKSNGNLTSVLNGKIYLNDFITNAQAWPYGSSRVPVDNINYNLYSEPNYLANFQSNLHANVLDVSDVQNTGIESNAVKVIDFRYDPAYPLAEQSPNSTALGKGKLTLGKLFVKGKAGIALIPPYEFEYNKPYVEYDYENQDIWGYALDNEDAWSMDKIVTPQGASINITYESDEFRPVENRPLRFLKDTRPNDDFGEDETGRLLTLPDANKEFYIDAREHMGMEVGETINVVYHYYQPCTNVLSGCDPLGYSFDYSEPATIIRRETGSKFMARLNNTPNHNQTNDLYYIYVTYNLNKTFVGGGIRVKQIDIREQGELKFRTDYEYSEGVTSYMPLDDYQVSYASEIIPPGVLYDKVTSKAINENQDLIQSTVYEFEVPNAGDPLIDVDLQTDYYFATSNNYAEAHKVTLHDKSAFIGRVKSISQYNSENHLLQKSTNSYKQDLTGDGQLGVRQESFNSYKKFTYPEANGNRSNSWTLQSISTVKYPSLIESKASLVNDNTVTTYYDKQDFLSGQLLESSFMDSYGREFKRVSKPAYYEYGAMGAQVDNSGNRNMLTQKAMELLTIKNGAAFVPLDASISTWKNWGNNVWRGHKTFTWKGSRDAEGRFVGFDMTNDDGFNWTSSTFSGDANWQQTNEVLQYNDYSNLLEVMDVNSNKFTVKMDKNEEKVLVKGKGAYQEIFYSGAEDGENGVFGGNVALGTGTMNSTYAHTGSKSVSVGSGQTSFEVNVVKDRSTKFKASLWAKYGNHTNVRLKVGTSNVNYAQGETVRAGDWVQLNFYFDVTTSKAVSVTSNSGTVYVDDFRVSPITSSMTSYVYNEWDELTNILGANNLATYFEYDSAGRLLRSYSEVENNNTVSGGLKQLKEYKYNYKKLGEIDSNGNGVIDSNEGYDPLGIDKIPENGYNAVGTLTIYPFGGSGLYRYSYAQGLITTAAEVSALQYGSESSNNQIYVNTVPCSGDSYGYNAYAVKVKVRDITTGNTSTTVVYYNKSCPPGGGGGTSQP
ncbi:MAG: hypothetical protein VXW38_16850 [Bacteroidota bacterium]|nr:hypothetical protein [Bacteroidota bacterium]